MVLFGVVLKANVHLVDYHLVVPVTDRYLMGEITVTTKASSKFASLRTTIPMSVVKQWKLNEGDRLEWEWEG